ncbi:hypothetical protein [Tsukamurella hominis]|uniref:hypothetical protein n=1 Tax=Tsukamurella hominis TaxID=1970232 RepID=UPI0039E8CFEA
MTTTTTHAVDFMDAITAIAKTHGMTPCYDSGPALDGRLLVFGDEKHCDDYLHGRGVLGRRIEIAFTTRGAIETARETIDDKETARVPAGGDIGTRLLRVLQLFDDPR